MGVYGQFVWSSYGIVFFGFVWMLITNLRRAKEIKQQLINGYACQQNNKKD